MDYPQTLNGLRIYIARPYREYVSVWYKTRRKYGRKWQRVCRFAGWRDMIADGEVFKSPAGLHMNERTAMELQQKIQMKGDNP